LANLPVVGKLTGLGSFALFGKDALCGKVAFHGKLASRGKLAKGMMFTAMLNSLAMLSSFAKIIFPWMTLYPRPHQYPWQTCHHVAGAICGKVAFQGKLAELPFPGKVAICGGVAFFCEVAILGHFP
jgi:hypothetical protein